MEEIIFIVEECDEGGYTAKALGASIYTEAETYEELKESVKDAINCHYDDVKPKLVRMHFVREDVFAL